MATTYTYIVDDQDTAVEYLCRVGRANVTATYYKDTWTTIDEEKCGEGWFSFVFNGTRISVTAPSVVPASDFTFLIDGVDVSKDVTVSGNGVYQSPVLSTNDGEHSLVFGMGNASLFPAFDYLTVQAQAAQDVDGKTVVVDDTDPALKYTGSWSTTVPQGKELVFDYSTGTFGNTTHWAGSTGDRVELQFFGSSITVYGVLLNGTSSSNVTSSYTVDGASPASSFLPPVSGGWTGTLPMVTLVDVDGLVPGNHSLAVELTDVAEGQVFGLDFVAFKAAYDEAAAMQPVGGAAAEDSNVRVGAVVGGVVGGVALLVMLLGAFFFARRRRGIRKGKDGNGPFVRQKSIEA